MKNAFRFIPILMACIASCGFLKISMDPACAHLCFRVSPGPHPKRRQASNWRAFTVRKSAEGGEVYPVTKRQQEPDLGTKRNSKDLDFMATLAAKVWSLGRCFALSLALVALAALLGAGESQAQATFVDSPTLQQRLTDW